jgi:hypothetical protein
LTRKRWRIGREITGKQSLWRDQEDGERFQYHIIWNAYLPCYPVHHVQRLIIRVLSVIPFWNIGHLRVCSKVETLWTTAANSWLDKQRNIVSSFLGFISDLIRFVPQFIFKQTLAQHSMVSC